MKLTFLDKMVVAVVIVMLLTTLGVSAWSLATGETLTLGIATLEMPVKGKIPVLISAALICLPLVSVLWLLFHNTSRAYVAMGWILLLLAAAALISFLSSLQSTPPKGEMKWVDITFVPLSVLGALSLIYARHKMRHSCVNT